MERISEIFSTITSRLRLVHHFICSGRVFQRRSNLCLCKHFRYQKFMLQIRLALWNNKTFLTIFGGDFLRSTEDAIPNITPDASQPRQLHPIRSVPFKPHYDHAQRCLVYLNHVVVLGHTRHPPINDVIASEHSIDVFLRYWIPGYPDCSWVGRQGCYFRRDCRNWKRDEVMRSRYIAGKITSLWNFETKGKRQVLRGRGG